MSIVSFSICSFIFVLMFIIFYFSKERLNTLDTKMYSYILVTNIIGIMIDVFGYFIFKIYGSESFISIMVSKFYLAYYFLWAYFFLLYIFVISFREKSEYLLQKKFTKTIIILTSLFICLIILIMPIQITYEDNVAYSSGLSVNMVYGLCFIMVGIMLYCLLRNLKKISTKEYIPLLTFMVLSTFCMIIQKTYPEITLMLMCHSIVTSLMYFTIENPDVKMVKELEVAKNEAEKANHAKSEFLSSMSHELRTPLNAIVCFSELLESKEGLDSESKDFAKDIVSASHNLLDLVNGVLDISKIEAGKMELINKEYNSFELFNSLSTMVIPRIGDKPIDFKTVIASDIPPVLKGDTGKLKQIILNLLTNAVKYTDKGFIKYRVECINDYKNNQTKLIITVTDTGRGIKKEDIDRLFKKFERLEEDRNTSIEGTGLGLAITESLAELMGGKITVISDYGKGSTFKFVVVEEIVNKEFVEMIPLTINIDGKEYKDGIDFTKEEFYNILNNSNSLPKTSQVTYIDFKEKFEKYTKEGYDVICITGSSKASGTYQSANLAKADVEGNIYIFDSLFLSLGSGQYIIKASHLIEEGDLSASEIVEELEKLRASVDLLFVPFTLEYLKQSGRLPSVVSFVGNMLSIKPICSMQDGKNKIVSKVRGTKQIASKLVDMILELNNGQLEDKIVTIGYGSNEVDFKKLQEEVSKRINAKKVYITRGGSCICSHTGPEILAISSSY